MVISKGSCAKARQPDEGGNQALLHMFFLLETADIMIHLFARSLVNYGEYILGSKILTRLKTIKESLPNSV